MVPIFRTVKLFLDRQYCISKAGSVRQMQSNTRLLPPRHGSVELRKVWPGLESVPAPALACNAMIVSNVSDSSYLRTATLDL